MKQLFMLIGILPLMYCNATYITTTTEEPQGPPIPYAFGYAAGRFPGHIDRTHSEISDGTGIVKGSYSYVDPRFQIRTVDYIADHQGFHPILNKNPPPLPVDAPVVAAAKERHLEQYAAIANSHLAGPHVAHPVDSVSVHNAKIKHLTLYQQIAEEHARLEAEQKALELAAAAAVAAEPNNIYSQHY